MSAVEVLLGVVFTLAVGGGIALTTSGVNSGEFWWARALFIVAAIGLTAAYVFWLREAERGQTLRILFGMVVGGFVFVGTPELLRWVDGRQTLASVQIGARTAAPAPVVHANYNGSPSSSEPAQAHAPSAARQLTVVPHLPLPRAGADSPVLEDSVHARAQYVGQLRNLYIETNENASAEIRAGLELPSEQWLNEQLAKHHKTWRVKNVRGASFDSYNLSSEIPVTGNNAPSDSGSGARNSIGDVNSNQGIVTQGQQGDNSITNQPPK